jgi:hypothetical protein
MLFVYKKSVSMIRHCQISENRRYIANAGYNICIREAPWQLNQQNNSMFVRWCHKATQDTYRNCDGYAGHGDVKHFNWGKYHPWYQKNNYQNSFGCKGTESIARGLRSVHLRYHHVVIFFSTKNSIVKLRKK